MHRCLYHPLTGYYRQRDRNPFGAAGDFFTAVQLAPFADAIAAYLEPLQPADVIDLGAGGAGLAPALSKWNYHPVDWDLAPLPQRVNGVILANEFFDALPVHLIEKNGAGWRELLVVDESFVRQDVIDQSIAEYAERYGGVIPDGGSLEVSTVMADWMRKICDVLTCGRLLVIDYGYDARELLRFPRGTLMSYHRHRAFEDVLTCPKPCDITAHVNFTEMKRLASELGLRMLKECSLASWTLDVFGMRGLERAWESGGEHWRLQWKQLVFGMGETFRVLEFEKGGTK